MVDGQEARAVSTTPTVRIDVMHLQGDDWRCIPGSHIVWLLVDNSWEKKST